jgi:NAD(P)H-hydrate epimerase
MKTILTPLEMKNVDQYAIKRLHIPSLRLMERAGSSVVREIINTTAGNVPLPANVLILCGKGNNGGDGFVVGRQLAEKNYPVTFVLMEKTEGLQGEAKINFQKLQNCKTVKIEIQNYRAFQNRKKKRYDVIVDAMLGTSFRGTLSGKYLSAVRWSNRQSARRIAVDIPTGLNGETGEVGSDAFRADVTVTMSNPKIGFYYGRAREYTGAVVVADIGIPKKASRSSKIFLIEKKDVQSSIPRRAVNSHKHSVGKLFVLAGSKSMMGAAYLCSQAAMRSGAGQVMLGIPESEYDAIARRTVEVMPLGLPSTREGSISLLAIGEIEKRLDWADVVVIGCGMSRNKETQELIRTVIRTCKKPLVVDADALNALADDTGTLTVRKTPTILTPHHGEFSRLTGISADEIRRNGISIAAQFAQQYHATLVLKGAPTVIAGPDGSVYVNSTGNPGMSTAGSGDVLTGIIASIAGQGCRAVKAATIGVYIHGASGDMAAAEKGIHGMIAGDIVESIPAVIKELVRE